MILHLNYKIYSKNLVLKNTAWKIAHFDINKKNASRITWKEVSVFIWLASIVSRFMLSKRREGVGRQDIVTGRTIERRPNPRRRLSCIIQEFVSLLENAVPLELSRLGRYFCFYICTLTSRFSSGISGTMRPR